MYHVQRHQGRCVYHQREYISDCWRLAGSQPLYWADQLCPEITAWTVHRHNKHCNYFIKVKSLHGNPCQSLNKKTLLSLTSRVWHMWKCHIEVFLSIQISRLLIVIYSSYLPKCTYKPHVKMPDLYPGYYTGDFTTALCKQADEQLFTTLKYNPIHPLRCLLPPECCTHPLDYIIMSYPKNSSCNECKGYTATSFLTELRIKY